jgi:amidophosphoribosyltransferase
MCGIFGIIGKPEAAKYVFIGLYALQHRGQESAGICSSDGKRLFSEAEAGLVADIFGEHDFQSLPGQTAIGHIRYSTIPKGGDLSRETKINAQPLVLQTRWGALALALNGNLVDFPKLKSELESQGAIFSSETDTEALIHLLGRSQEQTFETALLDSLRKLRGAYCFLLLTPWAVYVIRDPAGFRPLVLGKLGEAHVVASETCALDLLGAEYLREIDPGEILRIKPGEDITSFFTPKAGPCWCIFEHVYFARPDSLVFGRLVAKSRLLLGRRLAQETPVAADMVVPVPASGITAAIGYSQESGIPLGEGFICLIRNHYVGRTFIQPTQAIRDFGVRVKLNPIPAFLRGKRVVLVDDSIVRGTTTQKIVKIVRDAGATEVHVRITSPPIIGPCYYGIDTRKYEELIGHNLRGDIEAIRKFIEADSLGYLSLEGMVAAVEQDISPAGLKYAKDEESPFCTACFTREYPIQPKDFPVFEI